MTEEWDKLCNDWDKVTDATDRLLKARHNEDNIFKSHVIQMMATGQAVKAVGDKREQKLEAVQTIVKRRNEATIWDYQKTLDAVRKEVCRN